MRSSGIQAEGRQEAAHAARKKILVIEDNTDSRDILSKLLKTSGYDVRVAANAEAGLEAAAADPPDLIVTDVNMPRVSGIDLVRRIREDQTMMSIPVVVVTAFGGSVAREAVRAGANVALEKPFDFEEFLVTLDGLLRGRRTGQ